MGVSVECGPESQSETQGESRVETTYLSSSFIECSPRHPKVLTVEIGKSGYSKDKVKTETV